MHMYFYFLKKNFYKYVFFFQLITFVFAGEFIYWIAQMPLGMRFSLYVLNYFVLFALSIGITFCQFKVGFSVTGYVFLAACLVIILLIYIHPFTSRDIIRYLWDGKLIIEGFDPYVLRPMDFSKNFFGTWLEVRDCREFQTIYPPLVQVFFAFCALFGAKYGFFVWKAILVIFSILSLLIIKSLLKERKKLFLFPIVALSPLVIFETTVGAHLDVILAFLILLSVFLFENKKFLLSSIILGMGFCVKFLSLFAFCPLLVFLVIKRQKKALLRFVIGFLGFILLMYGVVIFLGYQPIGSLIGFIKETEFGSPFVYFLKKILSKQEVIYISQIGIVLSIIIPCLVVFRDKKWEVGLVLSLALPFFFSPLVYPWYFLPLAYCIVLAPSFVIFLLFSFYPLTYEVIDHFDLTGQWRPQAWPLYILGILWT
ncbi:MAG: DUF2029 domain-containing protein, partial [Bdellovibrio sp.]|nr:DUF2029 domain-containing protein [Bdellovibrio sp.]